MGGVGRAFGRSPSGSPSPTLVHAVSVLVSFLSPSLTRPGLRGLGHELLTRSPRSVSAEMVDAMKTLCKLDDIELSVRGGPTARTRGRDVQANQMGPEHSGQPD